jgi:hypothetical protein
MADYHSTQPIGEFECETQALSNSRGLSHLGLYSTSMRSDLLHDYEREIRRTLANGEARRIRPTRGVRQAVGLSRNRRKTIEADGDEASFWFDAMKLSLMAFGDNGRPPCSVKYTLI